MHEADLISANDKRINELHRMAEAATDDYTKMKLDLEAYSLWKEYVTVHLNTPDGDEVDLCGNPKALLSAIKSLNTVYGWTIDGMST